MPCLVHPSYIPQLIRDLVPCEIQCFQPVMPLFFHPSHLENRTMYMSYLFNLITDLSNENIFKELCGKMTYVILLERVARRLYQRENWADRWKEVVLVCVLQYRTREDKLRKVPSCSKCPRECPPSSKRIWKSPQAVKSFLSNVPSGIRTQACYPVHTS